VGVVHPPGAFEPEHTRRLSILDPESGLTVRELELVSAHSQFSGFSDRFSPTVVDAVDLDDDGVDEVLLSYGHHPYWPSYIVLYEPLLQRSRVVFFGSGHHRFAGAVDLDGDGARELLLAGINNRFGFTRAVAAVRPVPAVNRTGSAVPASSPDGTPFMSGHALVWYTLLPPGSSGDLHRLTSTDPRDRVLRLSGPSGGSVRLSYDGFLETGRSPLPIRERQAGRRRAYASLREANRLVFGGWSDAGLAEMERRVAAARRSGDPVLEEQTLRMQGRLLARAGRAEAAEAVFERVIATAPRSSSVAFDAGRAFHLAGELERAVGWYRRGFGPESSSTRGRSQWELVEGLVFALDELGRRDEARREFDRFAAATASEHGGSYDEYAIYRAYLCWRVGHLPTRRFRIEGVTQTDVSRYLILELRRARGEPAPELLLAVDEEIRRSSDTLPMLLSLRAELLAERGRSEEALVSVREALDGIERPIDDEIYGRAFRWLVEERAERLGVTTEKGG
jgi:tetratricopeptide (TPR) repeat protein